MNAEGANRPLPRCATIAIGTLPHTDPGEAADFMVTHQPYCPSWPQLPRADFREGMYVQYSEGMPAAVLDLAGRRIYFDTEQAPQAMADFYERYLEGEVDFMAISPDYARSFDPFLERMPSPEARFIKGQVTGPASFGLTVTDADTKPVLYHADLFEALVKSLALKGRWQVERFREKAPQLHPIIFYDEPYLTQVGSALISLPAEQVVAMLDECFDAIDGYTGIHVCGGTDWGLLTGTTVDILHFDAADHSREFLIYERELGAFMERGGMLAFGIVPTDSRSYTADAGQLAAELERLAGVVAGYSPPGIDTDAVLERSFISQACGTGTLEPELAERCFTLAGEIARVLQG